VLRNAHLQLGNALPDRAHWSSDPERRELVSPWSDPAWNQARTRVFLEALQLHRAFVESVPFKMRQNLHAAMDVLAGKIPPGIDLEGVRSAWASLFFLVPVVSTTFASFGRLFSHIGREELGWLLIDEAGQAVPQAAAAALWRARRAVVVGDPQQLEPIVTLPFTAQRALRKHFDVADTWMPSRNSVQTLADRVSTYGTCLESQETGDTIWVGSPLRVHRRCEEPMFRISNEIAYSKQMVSVTPVSPDNLPLSAWIDVRGLCEDRHWVPAEGLAVKRLLSELFQSGVNPKEILLLSPFRVVARRLKEIANRCHIEQAGTIHVSQGKEANVVILVLGGNPRKPGAKQWASSKPNLLNVAVSRVRHRLFIIGDRDSWCDYPYFSDAATMLDDWRSFSSPKSAAACRCSSP
jgi:hypothetical protein